MTIQDRYAQEWEGVPSLPEPLPLLPELEKSVPYPLSAMGGLIGDAVQAIVEAVQVPVALAAQSVLSAAAMAAQPHGNAQRAGQQIPLSLFALTVAESGDRKSAADRLALQAHQQYQRELLEQHKVDSKEYRDQRDAYGNCPHCFPPKGCYCAVGAELLARYDYETSALETHHE